MAKSKKKSTAEKIQHDLKDSAQKIWLAGLGALSVAEEEGGKLFRTLVEKGEQYEIPGKSEAKKVRTRVDEGIDSARDGVSDLWKKIEGEFDERLRDGLARFGVPSKGEIENLTRRVETLTKSIEELKASGAQKAGARKPKASKLANRKKKAS